MQVGSSLEPNRIRSGGYATSWRAVPPRYFFLCCARRRLKVTLSPLFPCYLFARFDLRRDYFTVKYTAGVHGLVSAGREPLAVPAAIVEDLRQRGSDGAVELPRKAFGRGERVKVVGGPFRGFDAIFERYLSSSERVAILLEAIQAQGIRVVLPCDFLSQSD